MKPELVILTSRFPHPLIKGDKLRIFYQIRELSLDYIVHLICINHAHPSQADYDAVRLYCSSITVHLLSASQRYKNILLHLGSSMPMQVRYFYDWYIHQHIKEAIRLIDPDLIHFHLVRMAPYALDLKRDIPLSLDYMDSMVLNDLAGQYLNRGLRKMLLRRERGLIKKYELDVFDRFDLHYTISERDRKYFPDDYKKKINVLPNGVDLEYFNLPKGNVSQKYDLIFCGNLSYAPNIEAANFLVEQLAPALSDVSMLVAGAEASEELLNKTQPNIEVKGYQEDIRDVYWNGRIMVAPIFAGSGLQNKVLEAMACGTPCIVTSFVNEALGATNGRDVIVTDNLSGFTKHIKRLLSRPEERFELGQAGRSFVERSFSWSSNTEVMVKAFNKCIVK